MDGVIISKKVAEELNSDPNWWKGETIQNTSNASSHVQVLEEEIEEWCSYCGQSQKKHIGVCNDA